MLPVALMILVAVLASLGGWVIVRVMIGDRAKGRRRCPKCWYDMQGSPTLVCPECGHDAGDAKRLSLTRRRYRRVVVGLILIAMAWYAREVSYRVKFENEPISTAAVPTTWYAIAYPALDHPTRLVLIERLKRVRGNQTDVWTWQGWLLAKQARRQFENESKSLPVRSDAVDLLSVITGRVGVGGAETLKLLKDPSLSDSERVSLIGCAATMWDRTREWSYVLAVARQLRTRVSYAAAGTLSRLTTTDYAGASQRELTELMEVLWNAEPNRYEGYVCWDRTLLELRDRPQLAEPLLTRLLAGVEGTTSKDRGHFPRSLEPLAVLCELRHEPSPIRIDITPARLIWTLHAGPSMQVSIRKTYAGTVPLYVAEGSGIEDSNFRIVIDDSLGHQYFAPIPKFYADNPSMRLVGADWNVIHHDMSLDLHTRRPPPGTYQLRVQYHDRLQIAAMEDVSGLIIFESEPVELIVE